MELYYESFNNLNIDEEIKKILSADLINVRISTTEKDMLFLLGLLFAVGKKIRIINKEDLDLTSNGKSFYIMAYIWEKLGDDNFPLKDYSDVQSELDILITNLKNLGFKINPINNDFLNNKIFLISPVRNITETQAKEIENYSQSKIFEGFQIHVPQVNTFQKDKFGGYSICFQNASAIGESSEIHMYYDQTSKGSMFDLGVAYYLDKPLIVINDKEIEYNNNDFGDYIVVHWNDKKYPKLERK